METSRSLDQRVEALERRTRRLAAAVVLATAGAAVALLWGLVPPARPRVLEAERFVVRDSTGQERAVLGLDQPSSPQHSPVRVAVYDPADGSSGVLYLSDAFAGVVMSSGTGDAKQSVQLFTNPHDGSGLKVTNGEKTVARLRAPPNGSVDLLLSDPSGRILFKVP